MIGVRLGHFETRKLIVQPEELRVVHLTWAILQKQNRLLKAFCLGVPQSSVELNIRLSILDDWLEEQNTSISLRNTIKVPIHYFPDEVAYMNWHEKANNMEDEIFAVWLWHYN